MEYNGKKGISLAVNIIARKILVNITNCKKKCISGFQRDDGKIRRMYEFKETRYRACSHRNQEGESVEYYKQRKFIPFNLVMAETWQKKCIKRKVVPSVYLL